MHPIQHRGFAAVAAALLAWALVRPAGAEEFGCSHLPDVDPLPFGVQSETSGLPADQKLRPASRLVFVRQIGSNCTLEVFDTARDSTAVVHALPACPVAITIDHETSTVFSLTNETVQEIPVEKDIAPRPVVRLPDLRSPDGQAPPRPIRAGRRDDGALFVLFNGRTESDDDVFEWFIQRQDAWARTQERFCRRFDLRCIERVQPNRPAVAGFWGDEVAVWHDRQLANSFVAKRESSTTHLGTEECQTTSDLTLDFGDHRSVLRVRTQPGPDSGATLTMRVELDLDGAPPIVLSGRQCETELMGRFLLLRGGWTGTELIDLETGKSVLGQLALAEWLY